jgi:murein DD-endopeptidase MepM/ murein hydrolase activator NlpD
MRLLPRLLAPVTAPLAAAVLLATGPVPPPTAAVPEPASWQAPLAGPVVLLEGFDAPDPDWLPGHRGVDLLALPGEAVLAAGAGTIAVAARVVDRGVVTVRHPDGRSTTYEPVEGELPVGAEVAAGTRLGTVGRGGHCDGACLHWGLVAADGVTYLDPMALLRPPRAILLPLR